MIVLDADKDTEGSSMMGMTIQISSGKMWTFHRDQRSGETKMIQQREWIEEISDEQSSVGSL